MLLADSKAEPELPYALDRGVERAFGRDDDGLLEDVGEIILSPGVPATIPLLQHAASHAIPS